MATREGGRLCEAGLAHRRLLSERQDGWDHRHNERSHLPLDAPETPVGDAAESPLAYPIERQKGSLRACLSRAAQRMPGLVSGAGYQDQNERGTTMRRIVTVLLTLALAVTLGSSLALAQNPHFVGQVRFTDLGEQLQVTGSIAGLGNENIDVQVAATGTGFVTCTNPGGNVAPGQLTTVDASGSVENLEVKNGRVNFIVVTDEPADPDPAVVCPNPQWTAEITDVAFTSATITVIQPSGSGIVVLERTFSL
jgi:hypothetical protein